VTVLDLAARPPATFLKKYLAQAGFLDGMPGLVLAAVSAMVKFSLYAKIWELQRPAAAARNAGPRLDPGAESRHHERRTP
jgi:hypothetical protein